MKRILFILTLSSLSISAVAFLPGEKPPVVSETIQPDSNDHNKNDMSRDILITAGKVSFAVTLEDNAAAKTFRTLLPLKVDMVEMNGNEKYYNLPEKLPVVQRRPGKIRNGDLLLWGSNTLVLFYETFSSSYSYTPLGRVNDPAGLAAALGTGNVTVTFEVNNNQ